MEQNECQMSTTFSHICPYLNTHPVILSSPLILISHWSELIHIPCSHWSDDRKSQKNQHFRKDFWLLMLIYERWTELNQRIMFGRRKSDRLGTPSKKKKKCNKCYIWGGVWWVKMLHFIKLCLKSISSNSESFWKKKFR